MEHSWDGGCVVVLRHQAGARPQSLIVVKAWTASPPPALSVHAVVKGRIERASTKALGLETSVGSVSLGIFAGDFGLSTFAVDNPEGFDADRFLILDEGRLSVGLRSILSDTIKVRRLALTGVRATVRAVSPGLGIDEHYRIEAPDIVLRGLGRDGGVNLSQLTSIVVTRVLEAVIQSGELPSPIRNPLGDDVTDLIERHRGLTTRASVESAVEKAAEKAAEEAAGAAKKRLGDYLDDK